MLADATQSYADTTALLKADEAFFDTTKATCEAKTREWGERQNMRHQELNGIAEALKILTTDEAKKLFKTSIKAGMHLSRKEGWESSRVSEDGGLYTVFNSCKIVWITAVRTCSL